MFYVRYLQHESTSEPAGPFTREALIEEVRARRLTLVDFVAMSGDPSWRMANEIDFLRDILQAPDEKALPVVADGEWVLLLEEEVVGPVTRKEILLRLANGSLSFDDLAWTTGEKNWRRIGDCSELDRRVSRIDARGLEAVETLEFVRQSRSTDAEEVLGHVVRVGHARVFQNEAVPEEASGEDLVGTPNWMKFVTVAGLLFLTSASQAAEKIDVKTLKLDSPQAHLVIETDAAPGEPIELRLRGRTGEVLRVLSVTKDLKVSRQEGEIPTVRLVELNLPDGRYDVFAKSGEAKKEISFFLGQDTPAFQKALEAHRKKIAARQQEEKFGVFYASAKLEKLSRELENRFEKTAEPTGWKRFFAEWTQKRTAVLKQIEAFGSVNTDEQAYPELLATMREESARLAAAASEMDQAMSSSEGPRRGVASTARIPSEAFRDLRLAAGRLGESEN